MLPLLPREPPEYVELEDREVDVVPRYTLEERDEELLTVERDELPVMPRTVPLVVSREPATAPRELPIVPRELPIVPREEPRSPRVPML
jgi:hypothetical protein